jgi:hypothetical protein
MKGRTGKPIALVVEAKPEAGVPMDSEGSVATCKKHGGKVSGKKPGHRADKRARGGGCMARGGKSGVHIKASHKGLLHKDTGTAEGKKIPEAKIKKAEHSKDAAVRKRAVFAENAKHWKKG